MAQDPHENDPEEDPLEHVGPVIADPWEDDSQTDWKTQTVRTDVGADD